MNAVLRTLVAAAGIAVVGICCAEAATNYVSLSGSHVPPFADWASAATNIQSAVDAASDGDTVVIGDGHYLLEATIVVTNDILLMSAGGPSAAIIDGQDSVRCFELLNAGMLAGLTITGGHGADGDGGSGILCEDNTPVVTNCTISGNDLSGMRISTGGSAVKGGTLYSCRITDNVLGPGISGAALYDSIAHNCIVAGNEGVDVGGMHEGEAVNCTIVGNAGYGVVATKTVNSIVWHNDGFGAYPNTGSDIYPGPQEFSHTCCPDLTNSVDGNITNAPLFMDPANGDYRLLATSPCIDAGNNGDVVSALDIEGNSRLVDGDFDTVSTVDMGAHEFQGVMILNLRMPPINLKSRGLTPVLILSTTDFDASSIVPASVRLAGAAPIGRVRSKGYALRLYFRTADFEIEPGDSEAVLIGQTWSGQYVTGVAPIDIVPRRSKHRPVPPAQVENNQKAAPKGKKPVRPPKPGKSRKNR